MKLIVTTEWRLTKFLNVFFISKNFRNRSIVVTLCLFVQHLLSIPDINRGTFVSLQLPHHPHSTVLLHSPKQKHPVFGQFRPNIWRSSINVEKLRGLKFNILSVARHLRPPMAVDCFRSFVIVSYFRKSTRHFNREIMF